MIGTLLFAIIVIFAYVAIMDHYGHYGSLWPYIQCAFFLMSMLLSSFPLLGAQM